MTVETSDSPRVGVAGAPAPWRHRIAVWPTIVGIATAVGVILVGDLAAVVLTCAGIYLLAAVTGRPGSAWIGFAASVPLVGLGRLLQAPWLPVAAIGAIAVAVVVLGVARGTWRRRENRRQLAAMVGFGVAAVLAATLDTSFATAVVVLALLAHAAWDIWHHVTGAVVARSYAESALPWTSHSLPPSSWSQAWAT